MKLLILLSLLTFGKVSDLNSQNTSKIDSLKNEIAHSPEDTNKVNQLIELSSCYNYLASTEKMLYLNEAYLLAKKIGFKRKEEFTLYVVSKVYFERGMYDLSFAYAIKYIEFLEKEKLTDKLLSAQNLLGNIYQKQGKFNEARQCFLKAAQYYQSTENYQRLGVVLNNMSILFLDSFKLDSALSYSVSAYKIFTQYKQDSSSIANSLNLISSIEILKGNYQSALSKSNEALSIYSKIGIKLGVALSYMTIGDVYFKIQHYSESLENYNLCLQNLSGEHWLVQLRECYSSLAKLHAIKGDFKEAYKNLSLYNMYNDSIAKNETSSKFLEMEVKYELSKSEKLLAEKEKEVIEKKLEISKKNTQRNILVLSVLGIALLLSVSIKAYYQKQKDNVLIKKQKEIVENKHKEITDSINYAERIQRSFLATTEILDKYLGVTSSSPKHEGVSRSKRNYFVFFRPKDVVSGDFYWAAELNNGNFAYCCADSTGHGVPGAIMSILNISSLEKSIETQTEPHQILSETRRIIINRLKKDGSKEGGKDGMDCSLLVLDKERKKLSFALANNPVFIVRSVAPSSPKKEGISRSNAQELLEFKADKMPVGKHEKDTEPFNLHTINVQPGDTIYTLTDGFSDQFGGAKNKKYMIKNVKELLLQIVHLPMSEQKQKLSEAFDQWKGTNEQVDDVCVIGVRV
ncbi:MAG: tetratricopeptide repeat protein [Flavobacteriales bacterium]|nr:tetratricopeptide repeat protein [Flavobacteriales bacterium]